jgi:hypothetical protein
MIFPAEFPGALRAYFEQNYPPIRAIETLSGMSGSSVYRLSFGSLAVIVKASLRPQENIFYRDFAPLLRKQEVAIPALYWQGEAGGQHWLALENIPQPLPRARWNADPLVLEMLTRLHRAKLPRGLDLTQLYKLEWTDAITDNALVLLGTTAERVASLLRQWQPEYQRLFKPLCPISADPNPGNWGVREDGSPVLFDWERFSLGAPAIDVAILIPGLPDKTTFRQYAGSYRKINCSNIVENGTLEDFAEDVKVAKVWTVLEFLYIYTTRQTGITPEQIEYLCDHLPGWLESLA